MPDLSSLGPLASASVTGRLSGRESVAAGATTEILRFTAPTNCTTVVVVYASARDITTGQGGGYYRLATFRRLTANVTQIGTTTTDGDEDDAAWDLDLRNSGTDVVLDAIGDAANPTRWSFTAMLVFTPDAENGDEGVGLPAW